MKRPLLLSSLVVLLSALPAQAQEEAAAAEESAPAEEATEDGAASAKAKPDGKKKPELDDATIIQPAPGPTRGPLQIRYSSLNVIRLNPLGLITNNNIGIRYRLYESDSALFKDNYIGVSAVPTFSGGFTRMGALAELQPLSVMRLWARFDAFYYYGIFGIFQSFEDPASDFSDSKISELGALEDGNPKKNFSTTGTQITLGLDLKIKLGPVAARSLSRLIRTDFNVRGGDRVYYEQTYDVMAPNHGFFATNDTDLLGFFDLSFLDIWQGMRVVGGLRNTVTVPFYGQEHYAFDNPDRTSDDLMRRWFAGNGPIVRAGPLVAFTLFDNEGALFNKPTILLLAQWHINHRWRTGADVSVFVPYTYLGFAFSGDFIK